IAAVREIERRHRRVHGKLESPVGKYRAGTSYDANDPQLQLWVHATLVDTAARVYEMFIGTLSDADRETYYEESKIVGRVLGIPDDILPRNLKAFRRYMTSMVEGDALAVGEAGRTIADSIRAPEHPFGLKYLLPPLNMLTTALLPEPLRSKYGYDWSEPRELLLRAMVTASQAAIFVLPHRLRFFPHAYRALNRESLRRPESTGSEAVA
ncbi:MAG: DUF2236 domain-containing protein, partial [Deltaproteobacteria bacterium]|nr:DUF2236 domain-containing protein [Deltaproteobacteria bacterium]